MKIVTKILQYFKSKLHPDNVTVITLDPPSKLSVFIYKDKVMVGTNSWKHELDSHQSNVVKSVAKSSKLDALNLATNCYHEYCNRYSSC